MYLEKILIVEDDEFVADSLQKVLSSSGYSVAGVASSGSNAISMTETNDPDLILMDVSLQDQMDGITAAKEILSLKQLPIIYLIPYNEEVLVIQPKDILPYWFLTKPVDDQLLLTLIRRALIYHAWGKISSDNVNQCFTMYQEVVCPMAGQDYSSRIKNKMIGGTSHKSEWTAY